MFRYWLYLTLLYKVILCVVAPDPKLKLLAAHVDGPKLDWAPVEEITELDVVTTLVKKADELSSSEKLIPNFETQKDEDTGCEAPNGLGIANLLKKAQHLIPTEKIKSIVKHAIQHEREVKTLHELILSKSFKTKLETLRSTRDYCIYEAYVCESIHVDVNYYKEFVQNLLPLQMDKDISVEDSEQNVEEVSPESEEFNSNESTSSSEESTENPKQSGVRKLLEKIMSVLPREHLRDLYLRLFKSDMYLRLAIMNFKSETYQQLLRNIRAHQEFKELRMMLANAGVPFDQIKILLNTALGLEQDDTVRGVEKLPVVSDFSILFI